MKLGELWVRLQSLTRDWGCYITVRTDYRGSSLDASWKDAAGKVHYAIAIGTADALYESIVYELNRLRGVPNEDGGNETTTDGDDAQGSTGGDSSPDCDLPGASS